MNKAVSLLELTIVLTIIGLLATSMTTGYNILQNAKINKMVSYSQEIIAGISTFKAAYHQIPGDMDNAYNLLGGASCASSAAICNGDGDELIEVDVSASNQYEQAIAFKHLALANIINRQCSIGTNCSAIDPTNITDGYILFSEINNNVVIGRFYNNLQSQQWGNIGKNYIQIASKASNNYPNDAFLTPLHADKIDRKLDDGVAGTGLITPMSSHGTCCTGGSCTSNSYNLTSNDVTCSIIYGFRSF